MSPEARYLSYLTYLILPYLVLIVSDLILPHPTSSYLTLPHPTSPTVHQRLRPPDGEQSVPPGARHAARAARPPAAPPSPPPAARPAQTIEDGFGGLTELKYSGLDWGDAEAEELSATLREVCAARVRRRASAARAAAAPSPLFPLPSPHRGTPSGGGGRGGRPRAVCPPPPLARRCAAPTW